MSLWRNALAVGAALAGTSLLAGAAPTVPDLVSNPSRDPSRSYGSLDFDILSTTVTGLHPGSAKRISLTFRNPHRWAIRVDSVHGAVVSASARGCRPSSANLGLGRYAGELPLTVPARGRKDAGTVAVVMPNSVVDACKGATFHIKLTGRATRVGR